MLCLLQNPASSLGYSNTSYDENKVRAISRTREPKYTIVLQGNYKSKLSLLVFESKLMKIKV